MAWVKLDDRIFNNRKVIAVSKDAKLMYIAGICFCSSTLSDGVIPAKTVSVIAAQCEIKSPARLVKELVDEGLWIRTDDGYQVHDYLEHNESSQNVRAKQEAARERMQRARSQNVRANKTRTSREVQEPDTDIDTDTELTTPDGVVGAQAPATPPAEPQPKEPKPKRGSQIPPDWSVSDSLRNWAHKSDFTDQDINQEAPKFVAYWLSKGEPRKDWDAGFQLWMRNARQYGHLFAKPGRPPGHESDRITSVEQLFAQGHDHEPARDTEDPRDSATRMASGRAGQGSDSSMDAGTGRSGIRVTASRSG